MKNWFKTWFNSPYYHLLYADRDDNEAGVFIQNLVKYLNTPPGSRVLDIGCGQGRHARQLNARGFDVTGIDLSENSIREAEKFHSDTLRFFVHDMRKLFWINYFDLVCNFFTSFGYFETMDEHRNALRSACCSLKEGGLFVLDYLNSELAERRLEPLAEKTMGRIHFEIRKSADPDYLVKEISVTDRMLNEGFRFHERVRKFKAPVLSEMLAAEGMQTIALFGDYDLSPFDPATSARIILIAKKAVMKAC